MKSTVLPAPQRMTTRQMGLLAMLPLGVILSFPVWLAPDHLEFRELNVAHIMQVLAILFMVALLAERALEIFVGTWRSPGATQLELAVSMLGDEIARLEKLAEPDPAALAAARAGLEDARRQERQYRCITRQVVLWVGLGVGLLVSAVGCRALEVLVDPSLQGWSAAQGNAFRLVDVMLTGGVIAGGSEGIHRIATVFDNFMSATAKRAKGDA
jgi:hypothetical protein